MSIKSKCTNCKKEFEFAPQTHVEITTSKERVEIVYAECPHCNKRWLILVEDEETKKGINKASVLAKEYQEETDPEEKSRKWHRLERRKKKNQKMMRDKIEEYQELINTIIEL